ncbi:MAG: prolipoprotein diacylglyceryl transferase [Gemmataceae bacterium]|nr:prolipoprotein diacylglyceryl transferase [Gemmataceae bacterium]
MQQILFTIPILQERFGPEGIPVPGFGAMLFVAFIVVTLWGMRRARSIGLPPERFQDFVLWIFVCGLIGARILYMIQYAHHFPDRTVWGWLTAFIRIWEGGIVFYGSVLGGVLGYGLFYWFVLRRLGISTAQLADVVAPLIAAGLAIGRLGCWLNGCCWGQVACAATASVPLGAAHFPLLPAHARSQLVADLGLQTTTGFALARAERRLPLTDPRSVVLAVEPGSAAEKAGLQPGDRIVAINGQPNAILLEPAGTTDTVLAIWQDWKTAGLGQELVTTTGRHVLKCDRLEEYLQLRQRLIDKGVDRFVYVDDLFNERVRDWPRGHNRLHLTVDRDGQTIDLPPFVPRTLGLYPTQLYETVSMVLLLLVLLLYYPYRRHDGQLMVLLMLGYALHRFINESLRIEPAYTFGLTLSQWGSIIVAGAAVLMEAWLWWTQPSRWRRQDQRRPTPSAPVATSSL